MLTRTDLRNDLCRMVENIRQGSSDFDLNSDVVLPLERVLKPAAVLVAITADERLILTKRATHLKHHAGQIAFAGGRMDDTDTDLIETALREAQEEIGLDPLCVDIVGTLPPHETVTNYSVTPVVALIEPEKVFVPEPGEVAEIFDVPLRHVLTAENYRIESRLWRGRPRHFYAVPFGPYYIWGATACILRNLLRGRT